MSLHFKNKYFILFGFFQIFTDGEFYSATSNNFLGTEPIILRSMRNPVRTEFKTSWLNGKKVFYIFQSLEL